MRTFMDLMASYASSIVLISRNSVVCGSRSWFTISSLPLLVRMEVSGAICACSTVAGARGASREPGSVHRSALHVQGCGRASVGLEREMLSSVQGAPREPNAQLEVSNFGAVPFAEDEAIWRSEIAILAATCAAERAFIARTDARSTTSCVWLRRGLRQTRRGDVSHRVLQRLRPQVIPA